LSIWALNGESSGWNAYRQVVYKYMPTGGSTWTTIETVLKTDGSSPYFEAQWPTLNMVTDGSYILGFETTDKNLNVQPVENNPQITVIVENGLPTTAMTSPSDGAFFCEGQVFTATVNSDIPIAEQYFEYKSATSTTWIPFPNGVDYNAPWSAVFGVDSLSDGYYQFRSVVENAAGRIAYSDPITLFYDGTAPHVLATTVTDGTDTWDFEDVNDYIVGIVEGTQTLTITACAYDDESPMGTMPIYNSGIARLELWFTTFEEDSVVEEPSPLKNGSSTRLQGDWQLAFVIDPADSGCHNITWNVSGLPIGQYAVEIRVFDKAGCSFGTDEWFLDIVDGTSPFGIVAGFWHTKILGMARAGTPVQFQYKQGEGNWIPIGIGTQVASKDLNVYDGVYKSYGAYAADWRPADGSYDLRMLTPGGDESSPVLSVTIANGAVTAVTSNPATGFGAVSIERSLENNNVEDWVDSSYFYPEDCEVLGIARIASANGYPYGIAVDYNVENEEYGYNIVPFRALPQQGATTSYGGPFEFWSLDGDDGGYGSGQVFVFDYSGTVGYSQFGHMDTYWITRDFGSGGPISYYDGSITVTVPMEWTDDNDGVDNSLLLWKSQMARPSLYEDYLITPIGDANGMMNYIGNPGCWDNCGSDGQYSIIKMSYDPTCNLPQESLMVVYWNGEGEWKPYDIYFPSTVEGFNTTAHTVEFAVTCLNEYYAVAKPTILTNTGGISRMFIDPLSNGYTGGYPSFGYQFREVWAYSVDWSTLEVMVDGVRVYTDQFYGRGSSSAPKKADAPKAAGAKTALDSWALGWEFTIDETAARLYFDHYPWSYEYESEVYTYYPGLECGTHIVSITARDEQGRAMSLLDTIHVDCTKPVVTFPNKYVGKDPTIQFTITDDLAGVCWDQVHVDVFWVTRDSSQDYYDYGQERVSFIQTFFPDQIKNYLNQSTGTVTITTSYNLENVRGMIVVVYDGQRHIYYDDGQYWGVDPGAYDQFDEYYFTDGGAPDCVGNYATPHVQYFTVDSKAPSIVRTSTSAACPMVFTIADDGSGVDAGDIVIRENGTVLSSSAEQSNASAVNAGGEWFFAPSGGGGMLYYCPTAGAQAEITITDATGNKGVLLVNPENPLGEGDVVGAAGPNPFDPVDGSTNIKVTLNASARVTVKIYDMGGDLVTTLISDALMNAGDNLISWSGTTEGGTTVANGVYLAHIEVTGVGGGSASTVVKIAVVQK